MLFNLQYVLVLTEIFLYIYVVAIFVFKRIILKKMI